MIKKLTLTIVCVGLLLGCAGMQPQTTFKDNTFTSDLPKLKVRILKNVSRMDDNLVSVYSLIKAEQYQDDIESFAKTRVLSEQLKRLINQTFDDIEKLFIIG